MQKYTITVSNIFDGETAEEAVEQMIAWLTDCAHAAGYRVEDENGNTSFIDAEDMGR